MKNKFVIFLALSLIFVCLNGCDPDDGQMVKQCRDKETGRFVKCAE